MSDTKKKTLPTRCITQSPNFVKYEDFLSDHTKEAKEMGITDKGTLTWYYNGSMDGVLYDIGSQDGHKGLRMYWQIFNTIRCITLPREINLVGIDKVKELRTAELDKLEKKIINKYKELDKTRGKGISLPVGVGVISPEESMEWLVGILSLRSLGRPADNNFGESITWGISPDDMCKFLPTTEKPSDPTTALDIFKEQVGVRCMDKKEYIRQQAEASGNRRTAYWIREELKKKQTENKVSEEEGSTADANDLADWIEGKTSKKPKNVVAVSGQISKSVEDFALEGLDKKKCIGGLENKYDELDDLPREWDDLDDIEDWCRCCWCNMAEKECDELKLFPKSLMNTPASTRMICEECYDNFKEYKEEELGVETHKTSLLTTLEDFDGNVEDHKEYIGISSWDYICLKAEREGKKEVFLLGEK